MGFQPSKADCCLFLKPGNEFTAVVVWVDDFVFVHEKEATWQDFIGQLRQRFTVPTAGPLTSFLGMEIAYDPKLRTMFISQASTIEVLLERARMTDCNPVPVPCSSGAVFSKKDCPSPPSARATEYASLVALVNFLACWTRPDVVFIVNKLCKFMSNPGDVHWQMLKFLLRYLKGSKQKGLLYKFDGADSAVPNGVHGYSDASYADCPDTSRSTIAYVFYYGGAILSWYSKLNSYVTTCTNHSEYLALFAAAKEAQWLVYLFGDLDPTSPPPIPVYVDNSGVVSLVFNPVDHSTNKHLRVACHYCRELTKEKVILPQRIPGEFNLADVFTKPLPGPGFQKVVGKLVEERQ